MSVSLEKRNYIVSCMTCGTRFPSVAKSVDHECFMLGYDDQAQPERMLTDEVLAHDVPKLERLLKQFTRGMMTAREYADEVSRVVSDRKSLMDAETL